MTSSTMRSIYFDDLWGDETRKYSASEIWNANELNVQELASISHEKLRRISDAESRLMGEAIQILFTLGISGKQ